MQIKLYKCYSVTIDTFSLLTKVVSCPFALADVYERILPNYLLCSIP